MAGYSAYSSYQRIRSKTANTEPMATAAYDNWVEPSLFPEVAPPPMKGTAWLLGKQYLLPQGDNRSTCDRVIL